MSGHERTIEAGAGSSGALRRDLAFVAGFLIAGAALYPLAPFEIEGASSAWRTLLAASSSS